MALRTKLAGATQRLIILAGIPFGTTGSTNVIHVAQLVGDELDDYAGA
jgi:pyruvate kinase